MCLCIEVNNLILHIFLIIPRPLSMYDIIAFNVPLSIEPTTDEHQAKICEANNLDVDTISSMKWAKAIRTPTQKTAHLILMTNNANAANRAITNGLNICDKWGHIEKIKCKPIQCLKCQGWNHFTKDCIKEKDTCGNCAENHRTNKCTIATRKCHSCKTTDHASWSRMCPMYMKKTEDLNTRNLDNLLQLYPTSDSWTCWIM